MMRKIVVLIFVAICATYSCLGQNETLELPTYFGQFYHDPQINFLGFNNDQLAVGLGHRRNSNNFGGISTSVFYGRFQPISRKNKGHHTFGFQFITDKEGFLIRRNRASLSYGNHIAISDEYTVAGGFTAGIYNFSVKSNDVTGGISAFAFDGAFNLNLYSENARLGISLNQFANSSIQPLDQVITLTPILNTLFEYDFKIIDQIKITPSVVIRYSKSSFSEFSGFYGGYGLRALFQNLVRGGANYEPVNGINFFLGVDNINLLDGLFGVNLTYFVPGSANERYNLNIYELFISYKIGQKKSK